MDARTAPRLLPLLLAGLLILLGPAFAPPASGAPPGSPAPPPPHELTARDAEAWLDGMIPALLQQSSVPGAAVVIVDCEDVLLSRGYGSATTWHPTSPEATPVDPTSTLFRTGSLTKIVTAVAALQLVEQGRLSLDDGIQQHIDVPLDLPKGEPTVRDLMTHTAGFEEYYGRDLLTTAPEQPPSLREVVEDMPAQIHAPGTVSAYSNHGTALLGYLVEQVSGRPFADYVETEILRPLGMSSATLAQPLPEDLRPRLAAGFGDPEVSTDPVPFEQYSIAPAAAMTATADDMGRFVAFLLGHGPEGVLSAESLELMRTPAIDPAQAPLYEGAVHTMGLQVMLSEVNGARAFGHTGDTIAFHSEFLALPDQDMGVFIVQNGLGAGGRGDLRGPVLSGFVDRYVAQAEEPTEAIPGAAEHAEALAGVYEVSRTQRSGVLKALAPLGGLTVVAHDDGTLGILGSSARYRETAPGLWTLVEGEPLVPGLDSFTAGEHGILLSPAHELHPAPADAQLGPFLLAMGAGIALGIAASLAVLLGAIDRRRALRDPERPEPVRESAPARWSRRLVALTGIGSILALAGYLWLSTSAQTLVPSLAAIRMTQAGMLLTALGAIAALFRAGILLHRRRLVRVLLLLLVAAAAIALVAVLVQGNLAMLQPRY